MTQLKIHFTYPLLLLVFLFGAALTALLYFRLNKKYRKNRNRITSNVLHVIVFLLAVLTLAGTIFSFEKPNTENQLIILVDLSDTEEQSAQERDAFIETVLDYGQYDGYRIGIVTFGFNQIYAVPMTNEFIVSDMIAAYENAEKPDTTATNIAAALEYAALLFDNPQSAKIVLVTDGKQTDEDATSVIRTVAAKGIKVDVANIASGTYGDDFCLSDVTLPDYHLALAEEFSISVSLLAREEDSVQISLYDNGTLVETQTLATAVGTQKITFTHSLAEYGLHNLSFTLERNGDIRTENNTYSSYIYLEQFKNILILEQQDGESEYLQELLAEGENPYTVTVMNILVDENVPATVSALRQYDQVILCNIANADMPDEFAKNLTEYVSEYGGGLFTVGGADANGDAHAYNREDMANTIYQSLLPVQAVDYKPPIAVMIIVDRSGSMTATDENGNSYYDLAITGASSCLNALDDRDYIGLMSLDSTYEYLLPITPCTQTERIRQAFAQAIENGASGGTVYPDAIERACLALRSVDVARRHVIIVSDGAVNNEEELALAETYIRQFYEADGTTFSFVGINITSAAQEKMSVLTEAGHGKMYNEAGSSVISSMREDLKVPELTEIIHETFTPVVKNSLSPLFGGINLIMEDGTVSNRMTVTLDGYFGVKKKSTAEVLLAGDYEVPLYAQWNVGKGVVGSFMSDLNGTWSSDFLNLSGANDGSGRRFILNVISALMPTENIRESEISAIIQNDNYTNRVGVTTIPKLEEGEYVTGTITDMSVENAAPVSMNEATVPPEGVDITTLDAYVTVPLAANNNFSRCTFVIKKGGVYKIELAKRNADGEVIATYETYQAFSYSEEYAIPEADAVAPESDLLAYITSHADGAVFTSDVEPAEIFDDFVTKIVTDFDPRFLFMILIIVLFLADIAVRKFKFKWPHEIVRSIREKKKGGVK